MGQQGSAYNGRSYAKFNAASGTEGTGTAALDYSGTAQIPTRYVKPGQGFMVKAKRVEDLNFNNSMRRANNNGSKFFTGKGSLKTKKTTGDDRFWLTIKSPSGAVATLAIVYFEGGNNSFAVDDSEISNAASDDIYAIVDGSKTIINGRALFTDSDVIPLGYNLGSAGFAEIGLRSTEGVFANGQKIYLKDNALNLVHDLSASNYIFEGEASNIEDRFELIYKNLVLDVSDISDDTETQVYKDREDFVIKSSEKIMSIEIYDLGGKLINTVQPQSKICRINGGQLYNGVYILKIIEDDGIVVKKVLK